MHALRPLPLFALILLAGCATRAPDTVAPSPASRAASSAGEARSGAPADRPLVLPPSAAEPAQTEGTKVLFLRLGLRTRRIEQELLRLEPEGLVIHLEWAAQVLRELRQRPLTPGEALRADRMEQYLQRLVEQYALLQMQGKIAP